MRRISETEVRTFAGIYPSLEPNSLLEGSANPVYAEIWAAADAASFVAKPHLPLQGGGRVAA
jgi:hypothetical protein